jgi:hypothetical protein
LAWKTNIRTSRNTSERAREVVEKFFVDTDESVAIDIYRGYIDESRDKTDLVVLL